MKENGYISSAMTYYAVLYAEIRLVAKSKGYALALHGSLQKDLDVIAIPWVEDACPEEELVKAICETASGYIQPEDDRRKVPTIKPHGRRVYTIHLGGCSGTVSPEDRATYIDLGVMPKIGREVGSHLCQGSGGQAAERHPLGEVAPGSTFADPPSHGSGEAVASADEPADCAGTWHPVRSVGW